MKKGRIISALPLSKEEADRIAAAFSKADGEEYSFETAVDGRLIGGVIVEAGGRVFDSSVKKKLEGIRGSLLRGSAGRSPEEE